MIGVIRVSWYYKDTELGHYEDDCYFDDAYYIIEYGSDECNPIDRDSLLEKMEGYLVGGYLSSGEYDEYGLIRYISAPI